MVNEFDMIRIITSYLQPCGKQSKRRLYRIHGYFPLQRWKECNQAMWFTRILELGPSLDPTL